MANLAGALVHILLVWISGFKQTANGALVSAALSSAIAACLQALTRGSVGNSLAFLAVWVASQTHHLRAKVLATMLPVAAFLASSFDHASHV